MVKRCYLVTEGPQDIEFLIRILQSYNVKRVRELSSLDRFWEPLIPKTFPVDDDLMKRVPVPTFLQNAELSIALHSAIGLTRLANTVEESLALVAGSEVFGIGFVLDADDRETPQERFTKLVRQLISLGLSLPSIPGEVARGTPRCGIFILPNNSIAGTLENLLLECAQVNYPDLLKLANTYVSSIDVGQLTQDDLRELRKPAGNYKAVVSSISSILRPGKTLQVSIQDNRWLDPQTIQLDSISLVKKFIDEIIGFA